MSQSPTESSETSEQRAREGDFDALLQTLADSERRRALEYLTMADGAVAFDDLVDYVTATGGTRNSGPKNRADTAIRLHHNHLPKMDAAGLLHHDPDEQVVEPTDKATVAMRILPKDW